MSAQSFAEPTSIEETITANDSLHQAYAASWKTSLWTTTSPALLVQQGSPWALSRLRRCFDFAIAFCAILISFPLLFAVGLAVLLTSRGPILFRQKRTGRNGVEFTLYKFRSMKTGNHSGARITVSGDSRITRVGSLLRRYKLDELPQFWNVLKGDMSLVGPRPKLSGHEALLLSVRPGITGPATLAFRHEEEMLRGIPEHRLEIFYEVFIKPAKAQIDFEYMYNATCMTDIKLLWATVLRCLHSSS
jgi:lipopolysaccharide/colanic/teichoic acid biosynthesis glycosyltransferase